MAALAALRIPLLCALHIYLTAFDVRRRPGYKIWPFFEVSVRRKLRKMKVFNDYLCWGRLYKTLNYYSTTQKVVKS